MKSTIVLLLIVCLSSILNAQTNIIVAPEELSLDVPSGYYRVSTLINAYKILPYDELLAAKGDTMVTMPCNIYIAGDVKIGGKDDVRFYWNKSGTRENPITITSYFPNEMGSLNRNVNDSYRNDFLIYFKEVSYITLDRIRINDASEGIQMSTNNSKVINCEFVINDFIVEGGGAAIVLGGPDDHPSSFNDIINNHIEFFNELILDRCWYDGGITKGGVNSYDLYHGIYLTACNANVITSNTIVNAPGAAIHSYHGYTTNNTIENNNIYKCNTHRYKIKDTWTDKERNVVDYTRFGILLGDLDTLNKAKALKGNEIIYNNLYTNDTLSVTRSGYKIPSGSNDIAIRYWSDIGNVNNFNPNIYHYDLSTCSNINEEQEYNKRFNLNYNSGKIEIHKFIEGEMFVVIRDKGIILKIRDNGSDSHNMFALKIKDNKYETVAGYTYLKGQQYFNSKITAIEYALGYTLIGFEDGRILKVIGTGGEGLNMFNIADTTYGFKPLPGEQYYYGSHKFNDTIVDITTVNGYTFVSFSDNVILKVLGTGGSGANLFAINEIENNPLYGFTKRGTYPYYVGDAKFSSKIVNISYIEGNTFLSFENGKMLKISGTGGTGHNMFAVQEKNGDPDVGFESTSGYNYYLGDAIFHSPISNISYLNGNIFISLTNGKMLKVKGAGGFNSNMFKVTEIDNDTKIAFLPVDNEYYVGDAVFKKFELSDGTDFPNFVTDILYKDGKMLIGFSTGKILGIYDIGGSGHDMFDVIEKEHSFKDRDTERYPYFYGSSVFFSSITDISSVDNYVFISFMNGKILKLNKTIPGGQDMFAVKENTFDFSRHPKISRYVTFAGDQNLLLSQFTSTKSALSENSLETVITNKKINELESYSKNGLGMRVYPNPSSNGIFQIEVEQNDQQVLVEVFNLFGKLVCSEHKSGAHFQINISSQSKGMYYVKLSNHEKTIVKKVIF